MTKICKVCGRELPLSDFPTRSLAKDGHANTCTKCCAKNIAKGRQSKKEDTTPPQEGGNPELAKFTPRELMLELKARNYVGKLYFTKEIDIARL